MNGNEQDREFPVLLRELRDLKREMREDRKEQREEMAGLRFQVGNLEKDVAALKVKAGIWGILSGGGSSLLLRFLGK